MRIFSIIAIIGLLGCENTLVNKPDAGIDPVEGEGEVVGEGEGECGDITTIPALQITFGYRPEGAANLLLICNNNTPVSLTVTPTGRAAVADAQAPTDTVVCAWRVGFGQTGEMQVNLQVDGYAPYTNTITVDEDSCGRPITRTIAGVVLTP
jgi:hypothetical protein